MALKEGQAVCTTIGTSSIEQKLAQMRETVARLTKKAEEQNLQVTALANTEGRSLSTSATNRASIGATITPQRAATKFVPSREQGEHHKREPVINLTSLEAPKHAAEGKPRMLVAQVMTIGAISVEEKLAQMKQTIARLTKSAEEKDLQITAFTNRLGAQHEEGGNSGVKKDAEEEEEPPVEKPEEKQELDQPAALLGALSIQQLQEMIANTIKARYEGSSYTSMMYSKPYSKTIMPRGYQPPKFMQFDGESNPKQHDKRLSIAHHGKKELITDGKMFTPKVDKTGKEPAKEAPTISTTLVKASYAHVKISSKNKVKEMKKDEPFRTQDRNRNTLKELEEKTYPFPDSDVVAMLKDLLDKKVIDLPECRRPEEMNRTDNPRYCKFHRFISHPTEKCFVLKDLIIKLAQKGIIELDLDDVVKSNYITVTSGSFNSKSSPQSLGASNQDVPTDDDEMWTLVTAKKTRKPKPAPRTSVFDRLSYSKPRISAFDRIGSQDRTSVFKRLSTPTPQSSVFERLSKPKKQSGTASSPPRRSALDKLEKSKKPSRKRKTTPEEEKLDGLAEKCDVQSLIPLRMKRQVILEVDTKGPLKVRRRTIVHTGQSSRQQAQEDDNKNEVQDVFPITIQEDEIPKEDVTFGSFNSKSSPQPLGAYSKSSEVEGWTHVTPKKLHEKHTSSPQVHQSERGQNSFHQPPKQCESVEDEESLKQRSLMRHLFFLKNLFKYSVKAPCYEDCEERYSKIGSKKLDKQQPSRPQVHQSERGQSNSRQTPERCESVGDSETSTQKSSIPMTMCDLFPEDFFDYSAKVPCYEDCEDRLSYTA